jgi:hypothetical protein
MKTLQTPTPLQTKSYKGLKITSQLDALLHPDNKKHLRLVHKFELVRLRRLHDRKGYLTKPQFNYVWTLYWNFILNDFRYDDKKYKKKSLSVTY